MTQPDRPQYRGTLADWHQQAPDYMREISQRYPMVAARFAAGPSDIEAASTARFAFALDCRSMIWKFAATADSTRRAASSLVLVGNTPPAAVDG